MLRAQFSPMRTALAFFCFGLFLFLSPANAQVRMPAAFNAGVGDLVAVRLAEPKSSQLAQILPQVAVSRALEINPPQFAGRQEPNASTGR
jgi:hypothetical protein